MSSRTKAVLREISDGALLCATVLYMVCGPCLAYLFCCTNPRAPRVARNPLTRIPYPRPLPTRRIDIRRKEMKPQPRSCHLLNLPAELRQLIFELVLSHRIVALVLVVKESSSRLQVHATFHRVIAGLPSYDSLGPLIQYPDDKIPIAFLRVCRQVYLEGTESMHRSNTYYSDFDDFKWIVLGGLGLYCLPHIRRVRMSVDRRGLYCSQTEGERWHSVCQLLKQAGIEHLTLEFACVDIYYDPSAYNFLNECCSGLLEIRGLRTLDITVKYEILSDYPAVEARDRLRALMVGPGADERYHAFLEGKRLKEQEAQAASEAKSSTGVGPQ
ncbi:hypothetical protein C8J57DRAFT_142352 [Mycena rebaudengoi]|nr:hypothetical protein C8J57DRAFT_142352 [Mycena rebaudengoi]